MALRRWKPFLGAFQHIDASIEASTDGVSCDEFRRARDRIVELLCDAAMGDGRGEAAEGLGLLLDEAMAGSLATLRAVPPGRIRALLAAPGGLVGAVGALVKGHPSERVRGLARDVVREWKLSVCAELARAITAMDVLDGISDTRPTKKEEEKNILEEEEQRRPKKTAAVNSIRTVECYAPLCKKRSPSVSTSNGKRSVSVSMEATGSVPAQQPKKTTIVTHSRISNAKPPPTSVDIPVAIPAQQPKKTPPTADLSVADEQQKIAATKRKLQERYQEVEDAKRQRKVQMINPPRSHPETTGKRQSSVHPAERRFIKPLSRPIRV